ncbi:hypothetical protein U1Q18_033203 [Sarracenia purpurea var. burkii]
MCHLMEIVYHKGSTLEDLENFVQFLLPGDIYCLLPAHYENPEAVETDDICDVCGTGRLGLLSGWGVFAAASAGLFGAAGASDLVLCSWSLFSLWFFGLIAAGFDSSCPSFFCSLLAFVARLKLFLFGWQ